MRAAFVEELGGIDSLKLGERPKPMPRDGAVVVKVRSAGVGLWDVAMISGAFGRLPLPFTPGIEIAGVVEAVGAGVDVQPGDHVFGSTGFAAGGFAEYALVPADRLARRPRELKFEEAAGLVVGAGTAYEGLVDRLQLRAGETVLITAAAGGVGTAAVQIAAALGARVLGLASPRNRDYVLSLGASDVFDYHDADWVGQVLAAVPSGVDVLFDDIGGETRDRALDAIRECGRAAFIVGPPAQLERGIQGQSFSVNINRQRLEAIGRLVDEGKLHAEIAATLPFEQVREALEQVAGRHTRGKIVLRLGQ